MYSNVDYECETHNAICIGYEWGYITLAYTEREGFGTWYIEQRIISALTLLPWDDYKIIEEALTKVD